MSFPRLRLMEDQTDLSLSWKSNHDTERIDRQTDRSVNLTKMNKIHNDKIYNDCGQETSTKTIYSRSDGGHPGTFHNS